MLYALNLPNTYKADALLAPAESSGGGGLARMADQLGGLAAVATGLEHTNLKNEQLGQNTCHSYK